MRAKIWTWNQGDAYLLNISFYSGQLFMSIYATPTAVNGIILTENIH